MKVEEVVMRARRVAEMEQERMLKVENQQRILEEEREKEFVFEKEWKSLCVFHFLLIFLLFLTFCDPAEVRWSVC
jgi:hypothetical protein